MVRGLLQAIVGGFGWTIGGELAREGISQVRAELEREARAARTRRLIALGVVLCLAAVVTIALDAAKWAAIGLLLVAAAAGTWVLLRPSLARWRAARAERARVKALRREDEARAQRAKELVDRLEREVAR